MKTANKKTKELLTNGAAWMGFLGVGAGFSGLRVPAYRYDRKLVSASAPELVAMGVSPSEAPRIASIPDPDERKAAALAAGATGRVASPSQVAAARRFIAGDMSAIEDYALYDTLSKTGVLPTVRPSLHPDGTRKVDGNGNELWTYSTPRGSMDMTENAASEALAGAMLKLNGMQQAELADMVVSRAMINSLTDKEGVITENVNQRMDAEYFIALADAARVKLNAGADPNSIDPEVDPGMELGEVVKLGDAWKNRLETARHDKEQKLGRPLTEKEEEDLKKAYSPINRQFSTRRNATLFRFTRGEIGVADVLEDVVEDSIARDMARTGRGVKFYVESIRALERELGKEGKFLADKERFTRQDVIEALGKIVESKVLADTAKPNNGIADWVNDFLTLIRKWVSEAIALVKLGNVVNKVLSDADARERLGAEFVNMVEDLAHQNTEFMKGLQRDASIRYTIDAATRKPNLTPTLTAAMDTHGAQVRKEAETLEKQHAAMSQDIAEAEAIVAGQEVEELPPAQEPTEESARKQEPAHPVDEVTQDEETRAWGKAIYNKARSDRGRRKALDMVRLAPQLKESGVDVTTEAGTQKAENMAEYAARCREQLEARARKPLDDETQARVLATLMGWERWHELGELVDEAAAWDGKKRVTPKLIEAPKEGTDFSSALRFSDSSTTEHGALSAGRMAFAQTIAENVSKMLAEEIERFRSFDGKVRGSREKALVAIGAVYNMARSVSMLMPAGYRVNVHPYMKQLQVFAEMAATGDLDLTADMASQDVRRLLKQVGTMDDWSGTLDEMVKEYGNAKVNEVLAKILGKVGNSLTKMERDVAVAAIQKLFAQLAPKKDPKTGKLQRGVMKAEGYEEMEQIADAMQLDAEALDNKLGVLETMIAKAEQNEDEAEVLRLQGQHILYSTFGNLADMNLAAVLEAYRSLQERVLWNRWAWDEVLASRRQAQRKVIDDTIQGVGGKPGVNEESEARQRKPILKRIGGMADVFKSFPQMTTVLEGVGAVKLARSLRERLSAGMKNIETANRERLIKMEAVSRMTLGKSWRKCMNMLHEEQDTGLEFTETTYGTAKLPRDYARELVRMTPAQRQQEWAKNESMGGLMAEVKYSEEAIAAMREELEKGGESKNISVRYVKDSRHEKNLRLSKGRAMYILLMYEQPTYTARLQERGFTEEFMEGLRKWMGEDVVAFAHGLRDIVAENTPKLKEVYERQFGVPFPAEENYFPARWNVPTRSNDWQSALAGFSGEPGANTNFLKPRVLHHHALDTNRDAVQVMLQAMTLSDAWMYTQDIVADLNAYIRDKHFDAAMVKALGADGYNDFKDWANLLKQGGARQIMNMGAAQDCVDRIYGAAAVALLGVRVQTWIRQFSAITNGLMGAYDIGTGEYFAAMARMRSGKAPMTFKRMAQSDYMKNRRSGNASLLRRQAAKVPGEKASALETPLEWAMQPIDVTDAWLTASGLVPVWNAYYYKALNRGLNEDAATQEAWARTEECADRAAQPMWWTNKSKMAQSRNMGARLMTFMLSEDLNKMGLCISLWQGGHKRAATRAWLVYGACNAMVSALLDAFVGDAEDWEEAHWWEYLLSAVYGPLAACPALGEALEAVTHAVLWGLGKATGSKELQKAQGRASVSRSLIDVGGVARAVKKTFNMLTDSKEHTFEEYFKQVRRIGLVPSFLLGATGTTVGYASLLMYVLTNPVDFGMRVHKNTKQGAEKKENAEKARELRECGHGRNRSSRSRGS